LKEKREEYKKEGGSLFGAIKKIIIIAIVAMALMYFFKRPWFEMVMDYIANLF